MYDPSVGRWYQEDPIWPEDHVNPFVYADNNPPNETDPSGLTASQSMMPHRQIYLSPSPFKQSPKTEDIDGNKYGNWKISQENESDVLGPYESRVTINFIPNKEVVNATEIAFVSIIRIVNLKSGKSVAPDRLGKPQSLRITEDYWFVDIKEGRKLGWYTYDNNGTPEIFENVGLKKDKVQGVSPGSSPLPHKNAVFTDYPGDSNDTPTTNVSFQFETYAIAKTGKDKGTIYGGISWGFDVLGLSKMISHHRRFISTPSPQFENAVKLWDKQASGPVDKRNDPAQVPLGPDIKFPKE